MSECDVALWHEVDDDIFKIIDLNDFLLWPEGEKWSIAKPKNSSAEDVVWDPAGAPVVFTGGRPLRHRHPGEEEMVDNRVEHFKLSRPSPKEDVCKVARCARGSAELVLQSSA